MQASESSHIWRIAEAKARLSEVLRSCGGGGSAEDRDSKDVRGCAGKVIGRLGKSLGGRMGT